MNKIIVAIACGTFEDVGNISSNMKLDLYYRQVAFYEHFERWYRKQKNMKNEEYGFTDEGN